MATIDISALPEDLRRALFQRAARSGETLEWIVEEALREYLNSHDLRHLALEQSVKEADAGDFATDDEVERFFRRYGA